MDIVAEILKEFEEEEKIEEEKRKEILANGCPCTVKIERIGRFSKKHYLECPVCFREFDLDGNVIYSRLSRN